MSYVLPRRRPSIHRRETGQGYLGAHSTYMPHIDLPVVVLGRASNNYLFISISSTANSIQQFNSIQSKRTQM
ncbi:unnamed protein product [Rotaria magnacalcarata]